MQARNTLPTDKNCGNLARAPEKLGAGAFEFQYPDLNLPLYNDDLWKDPPASVLR